MPYLKTVEIDELALPSNPIFTVRMKRRASYGDRLAAQSAMLKVDTSQVGHNGNSPITQLELRAFIRTLTVALIVTWTLTDEQDQLLAVTAENLDRLEPEDGEFLAAEAQKRIVLRSEEAGRPLGKRSGSRAARRPERP